jgi:hypothetical protein
LVTTALSVGLACIIAAIVGGGLKALGVEIPTVDSIRRQIVLASFGVLLILTAVYLGRQHETVEHDSAPPAQSSQPPSNSPSPAPASQNPESPADRHPPADKSLAHPPHGSPTQKIARNDPAPPSQNTDDSATKPPDPSEFNSPSLIGTWEIAEGDHGAAGIILLELRANQTYKKTLSANVSNPNGTSNSYGGTHEGTWRSRGKIVYLSGDANWPPYMQDLSKARKLN